MTGAQAQSGSVQNEQTLTWYYHVGAYSFVFLPTKPVRYTNVPTKPTLKHGWSVHEICECIFAFFRVKYTVDAVGGVA